MSSWGSPQLYPCLTLPGGKRWSPIHLGSTLSSLNFRGTESCLNLSVTPFNPKHFVNCLSLFVSLQSQHVSDSLTPPVYLFSQCFSHCLTASVVMLPHCLALVASLLQGKETVPWWRRPHLHGCQVCWRSLVRRRQGLPPGLPTGCHSGQECCHTRESRPLLCLPGQQGDREVGGSLGHCGGRERGTQRVWLQTTAARVVQLSENTKLT